MKKILCLLLAIVLCISSFAGAAFAADEKLELTLQTDTSGETLKVKLLCDNNPGICSAQFTLTYNADALECTSCEMGEVLDGMMGASNPQGKKGAVIAAASALPVTENGVLAEYTFNIIGAGEYDLAFIDVEFADESGKSYGYNLSVSEGAGKPEVVPPPVEDAPSVSPAEPPFSDLAGHWAEDYLMDGYERGILAGYPDGSCRPNENVTRAQFVTFLWRSMGEPAPSKKSDFSDLNPKAEYYLDAVAWAQENGYVQGVGDNKFLPDSPVSRQEVATILWRVAGGEAGGELMFTGVYDKHFIDSSDTPAWAKGAVYWAVYNEVWCGKGELDTGNVLASRSPASRAEIVVMMVKFQDKF